jgi:hypothetical protein
MKARDWLDGKAVTTWYSKTVDDAKLIYPHVNIKNGLKGLSTSLWQEKLIEEIIDLEPEWGFERADWFVMGGFLFCTDESIAAMFKMMQT